jgi:hypothetical protein
MLKLPRRDPEESAVFGMHIGDLGVVVIAMLCTFALIVVLVLPSPFAKLNQQQAAAAKAERQKQIDKAVATGEISVGISPAKSH